MAPMALNRGVIATIVALLLLTALPGPAVMAAEEQDADALRLYARQDGCWDQFLSVEPGVAEPVCYFLFHPLSEVYHHLGNPMYDEYPAVDGVPVTLDAQRPITGVFRVSRFPTGRGVGVETLDVEVTGRTAGSDLVRRLGAASVTQVANPMGANTFEVELDLPAALDGARLTALTLRVEIRGASAPHSYLSHSGSSFLDIPVVPEPAPPA
jgi:hypothetical protein